MNNQAAQTMPELLPCPFCGHHIPEFRAKIKGDPKWHVIKCPDCPCKCEYCSSTEEQAVASWNRRTALSQTAEVVLARGWFHALPDEDDYEFHDDASGAGKNCDGCIRAMIVSAPAASGGEDGALNLRGDETNQEILVEFIRVCREVKPIGQWPGERVCRAIENLMNGPRDFISPDDRSPLRFGVGRGNEGGRLGLMGRGLATSQHDAASDAKCIWPDCGHDTNQVGYSSGCTGVYCHNRADLPAKTDKQYADAEALIAHLDGLYDDDGQGCEKWGPAQAAIHGIRIWIADALSLPNPPSAAPVSERARALLATECPECGGSNGYMVPAGEHGGAWQKCSTCQDGERLNSVSRYQALRAIEQALTQQRGEPVAWRYVHIIDGDSGSWQPMENLTPAYRKRLADDGCEFEFAYAATTPQPSADAVREAARAEGAAAMRENMLGQVTTNASLRELVKRWRDEAAEIDARGLACNSNSIRARADELESLLSGGSNA